MNKIHINFAFKYKIKNFYRDLKNTKRILNIHYTNKKR
jgi:hypothetical protein